MKAVWNNQVIAEAPQEDLIRIEGSWYFPPSTIRREYYKNSATHTTCFWKGEVSYYDVDVKGSTIEDAAWYYAQPMSDSFTRVKKDYTNYVAFWHGVEVTE